MSSYQIIDEPKPSVYQNLAVNPVVILFATLLIPIFINLPFYGRFWMPLVWIVLNGMFMGSPTKIKELVIAIVGVVIMVMLFFLTIHVAETYTEIGGKVFPYFRIIVQGVLFFTLYLIVFYQMTPYSIIEYIKGQNKDRV